MGKFEVLKVIINDEIIELHNENEIDEIYEVKEKKVEIVKYVPINEED